MAERRHAVLSRPRAMYVDAAACIGCGACDDLAPGMRDHPERIAVSSLALEAMAACPVGAIRWLEGDDRERDTRRPPDRAA